jgi:excisionase family DNA binding protein
MTAEPRVRAVLDALDDDRLNLLASTVACKLVVPTSLRLDDGGIVRQAAAYVGAEIIFSDCRGAFLNGAGGVLRVAADYWRWGYMTPGELEARAQRREVSDPACACDGGRQVPRRPQPPPVDRHAPRSPPPLGRGGCVSQSPLLTLPEVVERVRLSPWAVRRAIDRGDLRAYRPCGRIRIAETDLMDWLESTAASTKASKSAALAPARLKRPSDTFRRRVRPSADDQ